jgi:hypothetical protein
MPARTRTDADPHALGRPAGASRPKGITRGTDNRVGLSPLRAERAGELIRIVRSCKPRSQKGGSGGEPPFCLCRDMEAGELPGTRAAAPLSP